MHTLRKLVYSRKHNRNMQRKQLEISVEMQGRLTEKLDAGLQHIVENEEYVEKKNYYYGILYNE